MRLLARPLVAAGLVATGAAVALAAGIGLRAAHKPLPASRAIASLGTQARASLAFCREEAAMAHDVQWAAACVFSAQGHASRRAQCVSQRGEKAEAECDILLGPPDDSPDCMLPNEQAARLNTSLAAAENRCVEQALAEEGVVRTSGANWLRRLNVAQ